MSNLVIVAIPDENDRVWKVSSEKVPHLTLLFLGDMNAVSNLEKIVEFTEHAANTTLQRFYLPVDRRGELGPDKADVLFFRKNRYDYKAIRDFRATLLQEPNIKTAYDLAEQFEGPWEPHLTLGYPETPAKEIPDNEVDTFYDVSFNKIAIWTGDYEGPEFLLKDYWDELETLESMPMDVAMSSLNDARLAAGLEAIEHFGTKGMRWGQRNRRPMPQAVAPIATSKVPHGTKRKTKIETDGGENHPAHEDAIKVAKAQAKLKKSGPASLSNQELRDVANRVQLEQQVSLLTGHKGKQFVARQLKSEGQNLARAGVREGVKKGVKKAGVAAAFA